MINALFSSQSGGTKSFCDKDKTNFGWKVILDLYSRECSRRDSGGARMVPKLRESFVLRDSWTKLNVMPAKIMQVSSQNVFVMLFACIVLLAGTSIIRIVQLH